VRHSVRCGRSIPKTAMRDGVWRLLPCPYLVIMLAIVIVEQH
jgi:hypothetical protein